MTALYPILTPCASWTCWLATAKKKIPHEADQNTSISLSGLRYPGCRAEPGSFGGRIQSGRGWPGVSAEEPTGTRKNLSGKYFLIANINLADLARIPIGAYFHKPFAGTFDGKGHAMVGCSVQNSTSGSSSVGFITAVSIESGCSSNPVEGKQNGANGGVAGLVGSGSALAERNRDEMISYLDAMYIMDVLQERS